MLVKVIKRYFGFRPVRSNQRTWSHNGASNRLLFHVKASFEQPYYIVSLLLWLLINLANLA